MSSCEWEFQNAPLHRDIESIRAKLSVLIYVQARI